MLSIDIIRIDKRFGIVHRVGGKLSSVDRKSADQMFQIEKRILALRIGLARYEESKQEECPYRYESRHERWLTRLHLTA